MKIAKGLTLGATVAAFLAVGGLLLASQVFAATGTAQITSGQAGVGESDTVEVSALDVTEPGLGAWTIDVFYDPEVISATGCTAAQGGVCNDAFADDTVRLTGAVAEGLEGDSSLGTITFECGDATGESPLEVSLFTFADGTLGGPLDIDATVEDGTFECTDTPSVLPPTGVGSSSGGSSMTWLIAALAAVGTVSLLAYGALRVRANRA